VEFYRFGAVGLDDGLEAGFFIVVQGVGTVDRIADFKNDNIVAIETLLIGGREKMCRSEPFPCCLYA